MRGLPGSGKSTAVQKILDQYGGDEGHVFSTDNYWIPTTREMRAKGMTVSPEEEKAEYTSNFDPALLGKAHANNLSNVKFAVDRHVSPIIVDNTHVKARDARAVVEYATKAGYEVKIQEPTSEWWLNNRHYLKDKRSYPDELEALAQVLHGKNTHGVPLNTLRNMINKWQSDITVDDILGKLGS